MSTSNDNYIEIFGGTPFEHESKYVTANTLLLIYRFSDVTF